VRTNIVEGGLIGPPGGGRHGAVEEKRAKEKIGVE